MERQIKHSCGHEQTHDIIGIFAVDYDRQAARLARQKCKPCYIGGRKATEEAVATLDMAIVGDLALVELQGSPKQVAWAGTIRVKRIAALHRVGGEGGTRLAGIAEAKWWIDHREMTDDVLLARCPVFVLS